MTHSLLRRSPVRAEIVAATWEVFSVLLFASAVVPVALLSPWPGLIFAGSLVVSAALFVGRASPSPATLTWLAALRALSWLLALLALDERANPRFIVATLTFGVMAGVIRRAIYRREILPRLPVDREPGVEVARALRGRLEESAVLAGIIGGHLLLLFAVAFLRAESEMLFRGWWQFLPAAAVLATATYSFVLSRWSRPIELLLAEPVRSARSLRRLDRLLRELPTRLSVVNFVLWSVCTGSGVFYFRTGASVFDTTDALLQVGYASLFSGGVAYYQRGWDVDAATEVRALLRRHHGDLLLPLEAHAARSRHTIREQMMRDFGSVLLFAAGIMLFSSISLYRAMGGAGVFADFPGILALVSAFAMLAVFVFGIIARVSRDLGDPIARVSDSVEHAAAGDLQTVIPQVEGPVEVSSLAVSVEKMRQNLVRTIAELEHERTMLESRIQARTSELRTALDELKEAQTALVQGERLASIGELVAGVAHEIHNPLNAVAGSAEPLEGLVHDVRRMLDAYRQSERELPQSRRRELETLREELDLEASLDDLVGISAVVRRATHRTVRIVQTLKNFSRSPQESVVADLEAAVDESLGLLGARLRQSCIEVQRDYARVPAVECRVGELNQVFMNLLTNAIQAVDHPDVADKWIRVSSSFDGQNVAFTFEDSGPGVPRVIADKVFVPFFTTKPKGQGTGLGLSISSDIVRKHGGLLRLETSEPAGARFVVRLPVEGLRSGRDSKEDVV